MHDALTEQSLGYRLYYGGVAQYLIGEPDQGDALLAQRFDPERTAPSEKIEHSRADDRLPQTGKDSRFDAIHCRPDTAPRN